MISLTFRSWHLTQGTRWPKEAGTARQSKTCGFCLQGPTSTSERGPKSGSCKHRSEVFTMVWPRGCVGETTLSFRVPFEVGVATVFRTSCLFQGNQGIWPWFLLRWVLLLSSEPHVRLKVMKKAGLGSNLRVPSMSCKAFNGRVVLEYLADASRCAALCDCPQGPGRLLGAWLSATARAGTNNFPNDPKIPAQAVAM